MSLDGDVEVGDAVEIRQHSLHIRSSSWAPGVITEVREKLLLVQLADGDLVMIARGQHEWRPALARLMAIEAAAKRLIAAIGAGGAEVPAAADGATAADGAGLGDAADAVQKAVSALVAARAKTTSEATDR